MASVRGRSRLRPTVEGLEHRQLLATSISPSISSTAYSLTHSRLYDLKVVTLAYQHYLDRLPDPAGLEAWVADLEAGQSDEQMEAGILGSQEYIGNHGHSRQGWLCGLYQDLLGRTPTAAEVQLWLGSIGSGATYTQVAYAFATSPEAEADRISADYQIYLGRSPEQGIVDVWVRTFARGASDAGIVSGFLSSPEYLEKHGNGYSDWYPSAVEDVYGGLALEDNWFRQNVQDPSLRVAMELDSLDGQLGWSDMISIFQEVELEGPVTADGLQGLEKLVLAAQTPGQITLDGQPVTMPALVSNLASKVIGDSPANALFQGSALGDLHAGSSPTQLQDLVDKWFLGLDHPVAAAAYSPVSGILFGSGGPVYSDVQQGQLNDCYLLAAFADMAAYRPSAIENLFTYLGTGVNGSSVWAVRFCIGGQPDYVTVDNLLPLGGWFYDHPANPVVVGGTYLWTVWAPLLEKAFAQEFGGGDYANLDASSQPAALALAATTGQSTGWFSMNAGVLATQLRQGALLFIGTGDSPASPGLVPNHCYAVVSYDPSSPEAFTLFNPWGVDSGPFPCQLSVDAAFLNRNFYYFWTTG
jgi:Calpain family cysteine protease/Domain of unknown function (DUF4214)